MADKLSIYCHPGQPEFFQPLYTGRLGLQSCHTGSTTGGKAVLANDGDAEQAWDGKAIYRTEGAAEVLPILEYSSFEVTPYGETLIVQF